jgi:beta-lactamase regulating signal transducer with metallopeptidase domain
MTLWIAWSVLVSALIALAGTAVDRAAALLGARRRFVWLGAMVCATIVPLAAAIPRSSRSSEVVPRPALTTRALLAGEDLSEAPSAGDAGLMPTAAAAPQVPRRARVWDRAFADAPRVARAMDPWFAGAWIASSAVLILIFAGAMLRLRRQSARWHATDLGPCRALVAPGAGPAVIGFARPRIVIPTWALSLDQSAQRLLLRHEMEHIEARDPRMLLAAGALLVGLPWNAALWWMLGRLRLAIEIDCDARVVRKLGAAHDYGLLLLAVGARQTVALPFAAPLTEAHPNLERRITAMTTPRPRRPLLASLPFVAIALTAMTAATRAPRPELLGAPVVARTPQPRSTESLRPMRAIVGPVATPQASNHPAARAESMKSRVAGAVATPTLPVAVPTRDSVQTAQPRGEVQLDSLLGQGRSRPGLRVDATRMRPYFDGLIGNPFVPILVLASDLQLTTSQRDSVVASLTRFERLSDSEWAKVTAYMAQQPDNYDIDAAWNQVLGATDSIVKTMLTDGAALTSTLSPAQLAGLPIGLRMFVEPACAPFFHQRVESGVHSVPRAAGGGFPVRGAAGGTNPQPLFVVNGVPLDQNPPSLRICGAVH